MKKFISCLITIIVILCVSFSCKQPKSLQELLQEERKAIDRFIAMNDLVILKEYPKSGVFSEKEYYKTNEGLFFQVVDSGNGTRVKPLADVSVRFDYCQLIKSVVKGDTTFLYPPNPYDPYSFVYGIPQTYSGYSSQISQAWVIPLSYVGEFAVLNMIVPSSIGSSNDNLNVTPVFYRNLRYTRFN